MVIQLVAEFDGDTIDPLWRKLSACNECVTVDQSPIRWFDHLYQADQFDLCVLQGNEGRQGIAPRCCRKPCVPCDERF